MATEYCGIQWSFKRWEDLKERTEIVDARRRPPPRSPPPRSPPPSERAETAAPLGRNPDINEVGRSGLYLISGLSSGVTGEVHFVDGGFNTIATPPEDIE